MADALAPPLIVLATGEDIDAIRGYRVGKWHEYDNFECVYCQYATLWRGKMEKHQEANTHVWAYPGQNQSDGGIGEEPEYE